ncbi:LamG-like jellyroll fold domain-containing protein [Aeoliella mucimassa]|uniref:LamG-like jellyroll fold domain-containing protein n=1 Tax=Aeoliella mucimassa TaxID=2527972 RepID=A0A518AUW4_9BACT|nr:LamG-like jellyroll fold domain-containing protein [Aeoliella mucimassa]QDU58514.1 hypothetical protein Pan181_47520 [Aeoliella mucimassa]
MRTQRFLTLACACVAIGMATMATAAVRLDRLYLLGDEDGSGFSPVSPPGTVAELGAKDLVQPDPTFGGSYDSDPFASSGTNTYIDLLTPQALDLTNSLTSSPTYVNVASRPSVPGESGVVGVRFVGSSQQYLSAGALGSPYPKSKALGDPSISVSSSADDGIGSPGTGVKDYSGIRSRGIQFWVMPEAVAAGDQSIISDSNAHGVRIEDGLWTMRYNGVDYASDRDSLAAPTNGEWYHVMQVADRDSNNSVLYVDGNAVALATGNYSFSPGEGFDTLLLGAGDTDTDGTREDFFTGTLDDVKMFVWGTSEATSTNYGTFDLFADNDFIADALSASAGAADVNADGVIDYSNAAGSDLNAFLDGWGTRNRVNGVIVADLSTRLSGDIDLNGKVDLLDLYEINQANSAAGAALLAAIGGGTAVPEPSTIVLGSLALLVVGVARRR